MEHLQVEVQGERWQVATAGKEGPILLLVHGFPLDHQMWKHQLAGLSSSARLIAPDLSGFGKSESNGTQFSMGSLADQLDSLLNQMQVEQPVIYCGLSMGGYIGWQFWHQHRDRLSAMIMCDTRAAADSPEVARGREMMAARVREEGNQFVAPSMVPKLFAPSTIDAATEVVRETEQVINSTSAEAIAKGQLAMAARSDATGWLAKIDLPTLFVVGTEDAITPAAEMMLVANTVPNSQLCELPHAGHMSPLEQPEAFNSRVIAFLDDR